MIRKYISSGSTKGYSIITSSVVLYRSASNNFTESLTANISKNGGSIIVVSKELLEKALSARQIGFSVTGAKKGD
jgi:hypothetical protein